MSLKSPTAYENKVIQAIADMRMNGFSFIEIGKRLNKPLSRAGAHKYWCRAIYRAQFSDERSHQK